MQRFSGRAFVLRRGTLHVHAAIAVCLAGICFTADFGFAVTYDAEINGDTVSLDLQRYRPRSQDAIYLSLREIVDGLDGEIEILTTRASIRLNDRLAWVELDQTRVGGVQPFSLDEPIVTGMNKDEQKDAFIAETEVPLFFREAFAVRVEPQSDAEAPALESLESLTTEARQQMTEDVLERLPERIDVVVIDAGHGGYDRGVESLTTLTEKDIAFAIAQRLKERLSEALPQTISMTREEDAAMSVAERIQRVGAAEGDLVVSLHCGASFSNAVAGVAVFYGPAESVVTDQTYLRRNDPEVQRALETAAISKGVAESIAEAVRGAGGLPLRGIAETPLRLQRAQAPVVLVEVGYLTNPSEEAELGGEERQAKIADAIAAGLIALLDGPGGEDGDAGDGGTAELEAVEAQE